MTINMKSSYRLWRYMRWNRVLCVIPIWIYYLTISLCMHDIIIIYYITTLPWLWWLLLLFRTSYIVVCIRIHNICILSHMMKTCKSLTHPYIIFYFLSFVTLSVIVDWIHHWGKLDSKVSDNYNDNDDVMMMIVMLWLL